MKKKDWSRDSSEGQDAPGPGGNKSSVEKTKYCESTHIDHLKRQLPELGSRLEDTRGGGCGDGELLLNKYRASVWGHENILETDSGVGCTRL